LTQEELVGREGLEPSTPSLSS